MKKYLSIVTVTVVIGMFVFGSLPADAGVADVRIDLATAASSPGNNWNTSGNRSTPMTLLDYNTGLASGLTLDLVSSRGNASGNNHWNPGNPGPDWLAPNQQAAMDALFASSNAGSPRFITVEVSGLKTDGTTYDVGVISSYSADGNRHNYFTLNDIPFDGSTNGYFHSYDDGYVNGDWMTWSSITPDQSGTITVVSGEAVSGQRFYRMNAMRILEIPEPATFLLVGLGGTLLITGRRKRPDIELNG